MTQQAGLLGVSIVNLGCRVNRVEADLIATRLIDAGCVLVDSSQADVVVVNTCAVTGEAQAKTRKAIRHACHLPQSPDVVACGCAANLFADELLAVAPNLVIERLKDRVANRVLEISGITGGVHASEGHLAVSPTPTGRMRPGIKIQDGCDSRCTYCIVWKARGPSRSLEAAKVVEAVRDACSRGAHEVVLTGINLGTYRGTSVEDPRYMMGLDGLLQTILDRTSIERIRLSSIEPLDVTESLLRVMSASDGRVAPFLHVCLQSGCDATLQRMGRPYSTERFARIVELTRRHLLQPAIETDVIVGFPGETDEEFEASYAFCERMEFARMHVFRYSKRPGTPAAVAPCQVEPQVAAMRAGRMRALGRTLREGYAQSLDALPDHVLVLEPGRAYDSRGFEVQVSLNFNSNSYVSGSLEHKGNAQLKLEG